MSPHVTGINQNLLDHLLDFAHLPIYFLLTLLIIFGVNSFELRFQIAVFLIAAGFGVLNEYIQVHVPGRSFSVSDMLVNALGAFLAILICSRFCSANSRWTFFSKK